ncbi:MAG: hypothetical protein ACE5JI_02790, partial [Acidobacteriota bacterium]
PVLGLVDDLGLLLAAIEMFLRLAPPEVVSEIEERYRQGHGPLRTDLENAEEYLGKLWSWAKRKVERFTHKYAGRVGDKAFVKGIELQSRGDS